MIKELSELGKTLREQKGENEQTHNALKKEPISMEIVIAEDGSFDKFLLLEKKLTISEAIAIKCGKGRLLLDKAEEILCYGGEKSKKKHGLFLEKLFEYKELPELKPVLDFYKNNKVNGVEKALKEFENAIPNEKDRKGNIGFRIQSESVRIHEKPNVLNNIIAKYEAREKKLLTSTQKNCSICGKNNYPVEDIPHDKVKKVPDGQPSGCSLVSYDKNAFESYGLKGNNNASICTDCAKTYVESLNWLLSNGPRVKNEKGKEYIAYTNRKNLGSDTALLFWTRKNEKLPEIDQLEAPNPDEVARLIESVASGKEKDSRYLEADQFYSCALSGCAGRIAVRDWIETSLFQFRKSIAQWFEDIAIMEYDNDFAEMRIRYSQLYNLTRSCQRREPSGKYDDKDASAARIAVYLWNAALKNNSLPSWILTKVLQRARISGVTVERAALIKLILKRNKKGGDFIMSEKLMEGDRPIAYICGQIFAKLESIQYAALGKLNSGIREKYFTYAMTLPKSALGQLFKLNSKHFSKLKNEKPGLAINADKELEKLICGIDINNLPATFLPEEQGAFAIGYYHQRQAQFSGAKSK